MPATRRPSTDPTRAGRSRARASGRPTAWDGSCRRGLRARRDHHVAQGPGRPDRRDRRRPPRCSRSASMSGSPDSWTSTTSRRPVRPRGPGTADPRRARSGLQRAGVGARRRGAHPDAEGRLRPGRRRPTVDARRRQAALAGSAGPYPGAADGRATGRGGDGAELDQPCPARVTAPASPAAPRPRGRAGSRCSDHAAPGPTIPASRSTRR